MKKHFSLLTFYFILSCFITYSQNNTDCWTLINNGVDIYNGQYNNNEFPGYHDPETTDLEEVNGGFLTTGQYNEQTFDSNDNNSYTNLEDKDGSYLTKHDYNGNLQWIVYTEKNVNSYRDVMFGSVEDSQGNIYVIGHSFNGTFFDSEGTELAFNNTANSLFGGFIIKLDEDGKILWHIIINNVYSKKINIDEEDNILLSGDVNIYNNNTFDFYLNGVVTNNLPDFEIMGNNSNYVNRGVLKINHEGELLWYTGIKTSGPNSEFLIDIGSDNNNNIYVTGYCSFNAEVYSAGETDNPEIISWIGNPPKTFLIKFNEDGQFLWKVKSLLNDPVNNGVQAWSTTVDEDGNSYITGSNDSRNINSPNQIFENNDGSITSEHVGTVFIAKVNTNGICEWIKGAADSYSGTGYKVIKSNDEIIVVGTVRGFNILSEEVEFLSSDGNNIEASFYPNDYFLAIYDADGNVNRIVSNGINDEKYFVSDRISGFFKDSNDNYYISRNIWFYSNGPQDYENFGHIINAQSFNGRDGTITKFNEDCGVVIGDIVNQDMPNLSLCDNTSVGTDTDGLINFDLTQNEDEILINEPLSNYQISYYKDLGLTDLILNPEVYENTFQSEIIYIKAEHLFDSDKSGDTSFEIEVYALPITNSPVTLSQCDDDLDGFSVFNLIIVNAELSTNHLNETITFHETEVEADNGANPIPNTTAYPNQTVSTDIVWARIENANECHRTAQVNLEVSTTQIPNTFIRNFYECDNAADNTDGIATFDFSSVNVEIENLFPVGQQLNINYYRNEADALSESNSIVDISNYQNIGYPNQQDIFIRVENATNNECLALGHHITLHVKSLPLVTGPIIVEQCDLNNDGMELFDTSSFENELSAGQIGVVTFEYEDEYGNALPSPLPNPFSTSEPITNITVTIIGDGGDNGEDGCEVTTNIALAINSGFNIGEVPEYFACVETLSNGSHTFNTSDLESSIINGQNDIMISFFDANGNQIESPFPNELVLNESTTITAVVYSALDPMCTLELDISFVVANKPVFWQLDDVYLCFDEDEEKVFDLRTYMDNGLSTGMFENVQINGYSNGVLREDIINVDLEDGVDIISYRIENMSYPNCYTIGEFNILSSVAPNISVIEDMLQCDISNDGYEVFNLQDKDDEVLNGLPSNNYDVTYHSSYLDAVENINSLPTEYTNVSNSQTIYTRLSFANNLECYDVSEFDLTIREVPDVSSIEDEYYLCKGDDLTVTVGDGLDYYFWSTGATTSSINISESGQYTITAVREHADLSCEITKIFSVYDSEIASEVEIDILNESLYENNIEILVEGIGDYEYSLDGVTYQDSNIFYGLTESDYVVFVRDKNGCGVVTKELFLLRYPKFFTPNEDSDNDYWQLYNSNQEPSNKIYIFDRYGKLLLQLDPMTRGWDGTFNGVKMPSSDYWFLLERQNGKTYTGHFSLVR